MGLIQLFIIAVGLSMDAFAVAICKGLSMKKISIKKAVTVGLYFGVFQAAMPLIGYFVGIRFQDKITYLDHWIAFILLAIIGIKMIQESRESKSESEVVSDILITEDEGSSIDTKNTEDPLAFKSMSVLAVATSIDALAVGVTFAFLNVDIFSAVTLIGIVTFTFGIIGVKVGNVFGTIYKSKAELAGGVILILMGAKILINHMGITIF